MDGAFARSSTVADGLAVQSDRFARLHLYQRCDPAAKALLEGIGVDRFKDASIGVLARNALAHVEKSSEPFALSVDEVRDCRKRLLSAGDANHSGHEDVDQWVPEVSTRLARVLQILKE